MTPRPEWLGPCWENDHANWRPDGPDDRSGPLVQRCCPRPAAGAARAGRASAPPDYGRPITNEQAKTVAAAAFGEAKKNNWRMAFTIVGPTGSWSISRRWTAPSTRRPTSRAPRPARRCSSAARARRSPINMPQAIPRSRPFPSSRWRPRAAFDHRQRQDHRSDRRQRRHRPAGRRGGDGRSGRGEMIGSGPEAGPADESSSAVLRSGERFKLRISAAAASAAAPA